MDPIEVFGVGADGELVPIQCRVQRQTDRAWADEVLDYDGPESGSFPAYRARAGQRPGGFGDRKTRSGGREDIMAPVPILPGPASQALHSGILFRRPIPGMTVDLESLEIDARGSSWKAWVDCGRVRRQLRKATLRAYPSPSLNLTILELVPNHRRLIFTNAFVHVGVHAISTLSRRLTTQEVDRSGVGD